MWWVPISIAAVLACLLWILYRRDSAKELSAAVVYRRSYIDLINQMEFLTGELFQISSVLPAVKEAKLWDYYEGCLRLHENLLTMFQKLDPHGIDLKVLNSAKFMMRDCAKRVRRTSKAVSVAAKGKKIDIKKLYGRSKQQMPTGCYFCSRPFIYSAFSQVRVRIERDVKRVYSCDQCRSELKAKKKVKVLYFLKEGLPVHWSKMSEYNPIHDFWNVNRRNVLMKTSKLELAYSDDDSET